jgi:hypothetical protein
LKRFILNFLLLYLSYSQLSERVILKNIVSNDTSIYNILSEYKKKSLDFNRLEANLYKMLLTDEKNSIVASNFTISHIDIIKGNTIDSIILFINYDKAKIWKNDSIIVSGNKLTANNRIIQQSRLAKFEPFSLGKINRASEFLQNSPFSNELKSYSFHIDSLKKQYLNLLIDEKETFFLNAITAFRPKTETLDALFTVDLDLKLENISGTGRAFDLSWKQQDKRNDFFSISYLQPWVLDYPIDLRYTLTKETVDSIYLNWKHHFKFDYQLTSRFKLSYQIGFETVNPSDSVKIAENRIPFSNSVRNSFSLSFQNLNRYQNPQDGIHISLDLSSDNRNITGPDWLIKEDSIPLSQTIRSIKLDQRFYYSFTNYLVAYNKSVFLYTDSKNLFLNNFQRLGGATTVRAFLNNQFRVRNYFYNNFELRFINSERERIFVFQDFAYFSEYKGSQNRKVSSYGVGFRLDNKIGIFGIDLALEYGKSFQNAVFHFTVSSKLTD